MASFMTVTGVRFVDPDETMSRDTRTDYGMFLAQNPEIGSPRPKTVYVDIPGADGKIDLTETVNGEVSYENRTLRFDFAKQLGEAFQADFISQVNGDLHGKVMRVYIDEDEDWYYEGRVSVSWENVSFWKLHCIITVDAKPCKVAANKSLVSLSNSDVSTLDPLSIVVKNWRDLDRDKHIYTPSHTLTFGTENFPVGVFYGFQWVEFVFEDDELGKTVAVTAIDKNGNEWTESRDVGSRTNAETGEIETFVYYYLPDVSNNNISQSNIRQFRVELAESSAILEAVGYVKAVRAKLTDPYAIARFHTDLPEYPTVQINSAATNGYYLIWNDRIYSSTVFGSAFHGWDERLRLRRGENVIGFMPRDSTANNSLMLWYRGGKF